MKRTLSATGLLFASISPILGSGWLFSALYTSELAGPASLLSWVIGGIIVLIIAFVYAEITAMLPITSSSTRIPQFTHGTLVSFTFSWIIWLVYATLAPTEVQAIIQYVSFYFPKLVHGRGALTNQGYTLAAILMLMVSALNAFSLRWLIRTNNFLTVMKIFIPIFISLTILVFFSMRHHQIYPMQSNFFPLGIHGMLSAISTGGIVFAFYGFKQSCEMAGEVKNPGKHIPLALIGSTSITLIIYLLVQWAFLSSLGPHNLAHGWSQLQIAGNNSPFAGIVAQDQLKWALPILYIGALIGPFAAALIYLSSSSRSLYGQSKNGYLPLFLQKLAGHGTPVFAILLNFLFGLLIFSPLPGWKAMITFLTSLMGFTYTAAPICLLALRNQAPDYPRPIKLPIVKTLSFVAFTLCTFLAYWTGWDNISKLSIALLSGFAILFIYHFATPRGRNIEFNWRASIWIWPYFIGVSIISYLGNYGNGLGLLHSGWAALTIILFCAFIMLLAQKYKLPAHKTQAYIKQLNIP